MLQPSTGPKRHISLATYFGLTSWMVAMIILWSVTGFYLWWNSERTEQQVRATARAVATTIAVTNQEAWLDANVKSLAPTVHEAFHQPQIAYITARLLTGEILANAGDSLVAKDLVWVERAPVTYGDEVIGQVEVAIFRAAAMEQYRLGVRMSLTASLVATLLSGIAAFAVAYAATRSIRTLEETAARWEEPTTTALEELEGPRELMDLAKAVLAMRERALSRTADLEEQVAQRTRELEASFQQTAAALAQALDARDRLTALHSNRTAELARRIGLRMGLPPDEMRTLVLAATLHDIGKIGVPEQVLVKPGPLNEEEWAAMRAHPIISAAILEPVAGMEEVALLVRHHHERWDGTGYPDRLQGEAIPLGSRIITLADTVEAMSARRHYRLPLPAEVILAEVESCTGTQFDPAVVAAGWDEVERAAREWTMEPAV